ncbi:helix-turn-helix domain-containing protein [Shinella sp.]|uniref:MarR family transcriptional regulator n=1 Tax=Shinella sp. TaxID=1870904 RepID=UPI0025887941|nr:helix-turn-helix domain-containing protein [Shinella sp.]MCW5711296.1 hypothetical protein [Shinella sp.]
MATAPGIIPTTILHHLVDGSCMTMDGLESALGLTRKQISNGAAQLVLRGLLERVEIGCYRLTKSGVEKAKSGEVITSGPWRPDTARHIQRHQDTFRQRVWSAIRVSSTFTISEIVMAAARPDDLAPENNATRFIRQLKLAGYLAELPSRQAGTRITSNGFKRWRLVRNTGPNAPVFKPKLRVVYDPNSREEWPCIPRHS